MNMADSSISPFVLREQLSRRDDVGSFVQPGIDGRNHALLEQAERILRALSSS